MSLCGSVEDDYGTIQVTFYISIIFMFLRPGALAFYISYYFYFLDLPIPSGNNIDIVAIYSCSTQKIYLPILEYWNPQSNTTSQIIRNEWMKWLKRGKSGKCRTKFTQIRRQHISATHTNTFIYILKRSLDSYKML